MPKLKYINIVIYTIFSLVSSMTAVAQGGLVCTNNNYALCSHSACGCFDEENNPIDCIEYPAQEGSEANQQPASPGAWSRCSCSVVENSGTVYDANYAASDLTCDMRKNPSLASPYSLPDFVLEETDIYSTYSFGDSIANNKFDTKSSERGLICDSTSLFADCLNMACYIPEGETGATCYCKNQSINSCQSLAWNTFGGECDGKKCALGTKAVWSAACINDTMSAMADVFAEIRTTGLAPNYKMIPAYCDSAQTK